MNNNFLEIAKNAKSASIRAQKLSNEIKNLALKTIAKELNARKSEVFEANIKDLQNAALLLQSGEITNAIYNRLKLDENKMRDMIQGLLDISELPDPVNKKIFERELDKGLVLTKVSCPIGVLGIIFEARPDVFLKYLLWL